MANSRERVSDFLQECGDAKKCKVDLERQLVAKRAEKRRYQEEIHNIKGKIFHWTQQMNAKEAILDTIKALWFLWLFQNSAKLILCSCSQVLK